MARDYGRFTTSIWRDEDFLALTLAQQGAYFMLGTQPDISAAGVLPVTIRRWSKMSKGTTSESLLAEFQTLVEMRHLVIDEDTEELLVRKFIKWDQGWNNPKRRPVIRDAALAVVSPRIRDVIAVELSKVGLTDTASLLVPDSLSGPVSTLERVGVTYVGEENYPNPLTLKGEPLTSPTVPPLKFCPKHPAGTDRPCGPCAGARKLNEEWERAQQERTNQTKAERLRARLACDQCDDNGLTLDDNPCRCAHKVSAL